MMKIIFLIVLVVLSACTISAQSKPEIFQPGVISKGDYESHGSFTPTGDTLYFIKCSYDLQISAICVSYRKKGRWTNPVVASFSGKYMDADPFVTKDGRELYFMSNRPLKEGDPVKDDTDLWKVVFEGNHWSKPINLGPIINSKADEYYPTLADNGDLYFGSPRAGGSGMSDIWCSKLVNGKYQTPVNLGVAINTAGNEYEAYIAPDESFIIYNSSPATLTGLDFYISFNRNGVWTKAKKLPSPFNTNAIEWSPKVTHDGRTFYFSSTRNTNATVPQFPNNISQLNRRLQNAGNSLADIYTVDFNSLLQSIK
ncbi:MAG: PD40 domain-containing protein [Bacteroidetes bacterium]|nr:PD40 domain-containing protein [Bacteroidota bacterium]